MMNLVAISLVLASGLLCQAKASPADQKVIAHLNEISGDVLVDAGMGFAPVRGEVALRSGNRVAVSRYGAAVLNYGPDCAVFLEAPSMTTVVESGCFFSTQGALRGGIFPPLPLLGSVFIPVAGFIALVIADMDDGPPRENARGISQ